MGYRRRSQVTHLASPHHSATPSPHRSIPRCRRNRNNGSSGVRFSRLVEPINLATSNMKISYANKVVLVTGGNLWDWQSRGENLLPKQAGRSSSQAGVKKKTPMW
jgi:hypothetical protein